MQLYNRLLVGLGVMAVVIVMMIVGTLLNVRLAEADLPPVYAPKVDFRQTETEPVMVEAKLSHYWPALGGPNCFRFVDGECISPTASGIPWKQVVNWGCACPVEYDFGTEFVLPGGEVFICVDRGGKIIVDDGYVWLDLLVEHPPVPFGTIVNVEVRG